MLVGGGTGVEMVMDEGEVGQLYIGSEIGYGE